MLHQRLTSTILGFVTLAVLATSAPGQVTSAEGKPAPEPSKLGAGAQGAAAPGLAMGPASQNGLGGVISGFGDEREPNIEYIDGILVIDGIPEGAGLVHGDVIHPQGASAYEAVYASNLWTNGVIPYRFDSNMSSTARAQTTAAMQEWEDAADIVFIVRTTESNFIHIRNSDADSSPSCSSSVGMVGGMQIMNLASGCLSNYSVHHELAHALGYWHEQSAADRDNYITINWDNIKDDKDHNFDIKSGGEYYGPYDFDSVMHYGQYAFTTGFPKTTIDVKDPWADEWQSKIGQRDHLSHWDTTVMSFLYAEPDWRFLKPGATWGVTPGSYDDPWNYSATAAVASTPAGGDLIILGAKIFDEDLFVGKAITLRAPMGGVVIN
jgi:hypothetical protein